MVRRDADGFADRGNPAGPRPSGAGMSERSFGVVIEKLTGGDQMASDRVGGTAIQRGELATDLRCELLGFDAGRYRRAGVAPIVGVRPRLSATSSLWSGSARRLTLIAAGPLTAG